MEGKDQQEPSIEIDDVPSDYVGLRLHNDSSLLFLHQRQGTRTPRPPSRSVLLLHFVVVLHYSFPSSLCKLDYPPGSFQRHFLSFLTWSTVNLPSPPLPPRNKIHSFRLRPYPTILPYTRYPSRPHSLPSVAAPLASSLPSVHGVYFRKHRFDLVLKNIPYRVTLTG